MKVFTQLIISVVVMILLASCGSGKKGFNELSDSGEGGFGDRSFDPDFFNDLNTTASTGAANSKVGSGSGGKVTGSDMNALQEAFKGMEAVNPGDDSMPDSLSAQARKIIEDQAKGKNVFAQKMALAGQILKACEASVYPLRPIPGQQLQGVWSSGAPGIPAVVVPEAKPGQEQTSGGTCALEFQVSPVGPNVKEFRVSGGATGALVGFPDGKGEVRSPFSGNISDASWQGVLKHPTFNQGKSGPEPCEVKVGMKSTTNPIPANFLEATRRSVLCHRRALFLMSPVVDSMFDADQMDPNLSKVIQFQILGIGGSGGSSSSSGSSGSSSGSNNNTQ